MTHTNTGHRPGCAFGRTARCTCTYLAQWDKHPEYTAPAFSGGPDKPALVLRHGEPVTIPDVPGNPWAEAEQDPDFWNIDAPGAESGLLPKLQLPVVIATGGDPAELAEKIVRQNPEYFGHIDPEGIYRPTSDIEDTGSAEYHRTRARQYREDRMKALDMYDHQKRRAEYWKNHALIASILGFAGWAYAVAIVVAGKGF